MPGPGHAVLEAGRHLRGQLSRNAARPWSFSRTTPRASAAECGHRFVNPQMDFGCAAYCPYAEQCLGTLPEGLAAQKENLLKDRVAVEMKRYFRTTSSASAAPAGWRALRRAHRQGRAGQPGGDPDGRLPARHRRVPPSARTAAPPPRTPRPKARPWRGRSSPNSAPGRS
ncbi:MAG: hypothetical protein MZV70_68220 [Desulfobacterales bacterium]|nr:hypothetical protein [Desulfobacterales bacterium]